MPYSPLVTATLQSASLSALSNVIGQSIQCYRANKQFTLNTTDLFHFTLYSILVTPLNFLWQSFLEGHFPAYTTATTKQPKSDSKQERNAGKTLNLKNTAIKFALDQTFGAAFNTVLFIIGIDLLRSQSIEKIRLDLISGFWPIIFAGQKLWPLVSIINFTVVPLEYRTLVGSIVGVFWNVWLSLVSSSVK